MRRSKGRPCPRECGRRLLGGEQAKYNARSLIDNKQICVECRIEELKREFVRT